MILHCDQHSRFPNLYQIEFSQYVAITIQSKGNTQQNHQVI
jgi:hypothetical protein